MSEDIGPARESTDESLRTERDKTDAELLRRRESVEQRATGVVEAARLEADGVVQAVREHTDQAAVGRTNVEASIVVAERAVADHALQSERDITDQIVRKERDERKRALASLLRMEREETDDHLLTERQRSDQELSTRDIFLAMVSHDLRNMLGGIALTAESLTHDSDAPPAGRVRTSAERIQRLTARMNRIVGDLVDIASIEAGALLVEPKAQDVVALVREALEAARASAEPRGITVEPTVSGPPVALALVDRGRLLQVLGNLLANAIKFAPARANARVSARVEVLGKEVRIAVVDTGPGIPAEQLEAIFGRFWQARSKDRRGLGLGLYISRCIVEGHGGRIWAESVVGQGSTFVIAVPGAAVDRDNR